MVEQFVYTIFLLVLIQIMAVGEMCINGVNFIVLK